jgi:hypothetical protein
LRIAECACLPCLPQAGAGRDFGMKSFQLSALNFEFQILNFELLNFIIFNEGGIWGDR